MGESELEARRIAEEILDRPAGTTYREATLARAYLDREVELRIRLGCAIEELERRCPLGYDPVTAAIIRDGRATLAEEADHEA